MPVLSKRIVLDCFYLLIFYFEKFSINVCRLPCAVNVNLNLSNLSIIQIRDLIELTTSLTLGNRIVRVFKLSSRALDKNLSQ